jgi:glycosyltransferase involved in cell wall biosynthesis
MAVRNGMPFLPQTLASIEAQTYPHHSILVWDNGSTDGTLEELAKWIPSRLAGTVIGNNPLGLGASRAALVNLARTEFIVWHDADDLSHPERIAKQVSYLQENPDTVLVGSQIETIDDRGNPHPWSWEAPLDDAEIRWATRWTPKILTGASMFRRSKVIQAGNYRDTKPTEDHDLLVRLSLFGRMPNHPEALFKYRRHGAAITTNVADHFLQYRTCALLNANILFPGFSPERAMYLWDQVARLNSDQPAKPSDLFLLWRAAKALAAALGEDPSYFRSNAFFNEQEYHLKRRILQSLGLGSLWRFRQTLSHITQK